MSDPSPSQPTPNSLPAPPAWPRRKRIAAREIESVNLDSASLTPAEFQPLDLSPLPPAPAPVPAQESDFVADSTPVVDPTTLGRRHRRSSHHVIYRWTQFWTLLSVLLASLGIVCTMADEPELGRIFAGAGVAGGIVAVMLAGRTSLSERWRGWAIAAIVFAAASVGLTWIHSNLIDSERGAPTIRSVK